MKRKHWNRAVEAFAIGCLAGAALKIGERLVRRARLNEHAAEEAVRRSYLTADRVAELAGAVDVLRQEVDDLARAIAATETEPAGKRDGCDECDGFGLLVEHVTCPKCGPAAPEERPRPRGGLSALMDPVIRATETA